MRSPTLHRIALTCAGLAAALAPSGPAAAQEIDPEPGESAVMLDHSADIPRYGAGLRLRYVAVPAGLVELFMEEAAGGVGTPGVGLDFVRRRDNFEFSIGFEYESLSPDDGFYVENGGSAQRPGTIDYVEFDGFSWLTLDAAFVFHEPLSDTVALRYGGGLGLGILFGDVFQTDAVCTGNDVQEDCMRDENAPQVDDPADLPPVFPVVNVLGGVQIRAHDDVLVNVELGLRTVPYVGVGVQYLMN